MRAPETVILHQKEYRTTGKNEVSSRLSTLTRNLARFIGAYEHSEPFHISEPLPGRWYWVPVFTLVQQEAAELGIINDEQIYGGVVPREHLTAKGFFHPLVRERASHPTRYSRRFLGEVEDSVLPGHTIFDKSDAPRAVRLLNQRGFTPLGKKAQASSGDGQHFIRSSLDLQDALSSVNDDEVRRFGYVLEAGLMPETVNTISVGRVCVEDIVFTYYGKQNLTEDINGKKRYGGTEMYIVRGEFPDLIARVQSHKTPVIKGLTKENILRAIEQAKTFDEYALTTLHVFGSRRNYDVVQGYTEDGTFHSGVTDQSWRIGGASGPEILALQEFRDNRNRQTLLGSSFFLYGKLIPRGFITRRDPRIPTHAEIYFEGVDPERYEGKLTSGATIGNVQVDIDSDWVLSRDRFK